VWAELVILPPAPEDEREDHGRAEDHRRDRKAVCHGLMLAPIGIPRKFPELLVASYILRPAKSCHSHMTRSSDAQLAGTSIATFPAPRFHKEATECS